MVDTTRLHESRTDETAAKAAGIAARVAALIAQLPAERDNIRARLTNSVLRPLQTIKQATAPAHPAATPSHSKYERAGDKEPDRLWSLARATTELAVRSPSAPPLIEAAAALQDLALSDADGRAVAQRRRDLEKLQRNLDPAIHVAHDGPYLVVNPRTIVDHLGVKVEVRAMTALCRCGASQIKPFCDGSHAATGYSGTKDPNRVPDHVDTYVGEQVTILDNRGTCQHAGYCTDRLATVFHTDGDPFVTPSGGRMDEIVRAVRDCPSGTLSFAIDSVEARAAVDHHGTREPSIEVSKDGPYRITGGIPLVDHNGTDIPRNHGASREHYALCRCGHSQNKPFCSGMHWYVQFRDPVPDADTEPTPFEWAGGLPALTRMTRIFYEKYIPEDPLLAPLFASMSPDHPERVAKWLAEVFGGPKHYSTDYGGYTRMISQHLGKAITEEQRSRWVTLLTAAARDAGLANDAEFRSLLGSYIEWGTRLAYENSQSGALPPADMPMPHWDWTTAAGPPGSRHSALAPTDDDPETDIVLPSEEDPVRFASHIKPMFRHLDRQSMKFAFDLWSYDDVAQHADAILTRLRGGTMPCDRAWPTEQIAVFARWADGDKEP
jgi:CDGSH-type Zn-finger protein/truncated hemoglobin YjbI